MVSLRVIFNVRTALRKLRSYFQRLSQNSRREWPVISAIQPLYYLIRLFGLAPFEISEGHFVPRSYDVVYSLLCTLAHTYIMYHFISEMSCKMYPGFQRISTTGTVFFNYCVVVFNILMAVWTRKKFIAVLTIVKHFDSRMRDLGYPRKERDTKVWVWSTGICTAVIWIIVSCAGLAAFAESWTDNVLHLLNYLSNSLCTVKFSSAVLLLGQRFRDLNKVAQLSKESAAIQRQYFFPIDFQVIKQLHSSLMNAGESLSSQYEWPLLLWLTNMSLHIVLYLYFLIDSFIVTPEWAVARWTLIHCTAWWVITCIVQLLLLHIACHFTSAEANSLGSKVIVRRSLTASRSCSVEPSLHLMNRKLNFSVAGCCHVNMLLLRSITALLTTYLVLLFQFHS